MEENRNSIDLLHDDAYDGAPVLEVLAQPELLASYLMTEWSKRSLTLDHLRRLWKFAVPPLLYPLTSPASVDSAMDLKVLGRKLFEPLERFMFEPKRFDEMAEVNIDCA